MQTITLSLDGAFKVTETFEVEDAELVGVITKLREVLQPDGAPAPKRRGRKPKAADDATANGEASTMGADDESAAEPEPLFR